MNLATSLNRCCKAPTSFSPSMSPCPGCRPTDKVRDDAKVIHMGPDPLHGYVPVRGHPCDIALACATAEGLQRA